MSSTTTKTSSQPSPWWYCGGCGFKNKPRHYGDKTRCEQCGAKRDDPELAHTDYKPEGAS